MSPTVLITGQLLTNAIWQPMIAGWNDREFVLADHQNDDTIAGMATRLLANAPARFDLVGHAMGGFVAFEVMRRAPERVGKLALLASLASADGPAQAARRQGYIDLVQAGRFEQVVEERIPILFLPARRDDAHLLAIARAMAKDTGADTFLRQQRAIMAREDSRPALAAITVKTLLVWGDADAITSRDHQDEMLRSIPHSSLVVIPDAGHLAMIEQPERTGQILRDFLAD
jgi:pimeloyl-ACP methyl ester carboxylesterase